ncbi:MAG: oxidoreductase/nitrogenase component 1 [Paenibacillaceae bacterium]|jgi:nitrogenase molybdenum-iron protein beta chain|nr:oxidoreductase/nitrogenase component 1 [Paenibacillaceae bacterium]
MNAPVAINRNNCMLHGAVQTVKAIEGAVPVIHSTAGCGVQQYWGGSTLSGCSGSGYSGGLGIPSTNVMERQVVFGGTSRLREQLKNTLKVKKGDFYIVLSGCTTELVGDDIPAMTKELHDQSYKAAHISTPGFKGHVHDGYTATVKGILQQFDKISDGRLPGKNGRLVNLFGIIPEQDVHWQGNLAGLADALSSIDVSANVLFGPGAGVEEWSSIPGAALNLSFSAYGIEICRWLEERFGIPYLAFDSYPVGAGQSAELLRRVAEALKLEQTAVEEQLQRREREERYHIRNILDVYSRFDFQRRTALVGDSGVVLGIARFLADPLGLLPVKVIVTDPLNAAARSALSREWSRTGQQAELIFEADALRIEAILQESGIELVAGSSIEEAVALRNGIPFVPVAFPVSNRVVLRKGYSGYNGAITLLEDVGNAILAGH